ncbi:hypothetical protein [Amycolatopsis sacchari]|uniref:hypothetical protein n=1 Tax=Amycolatopsis sacchari TaxID=115433 RepID=UPI003EBA22B0
MGRHELRDGVGRPVIGVASHHSGRHSAEMMDAPTIRFFFDERELLAAPTEELPAIVDTQPIWPTEDDLADIEAEVARAGEVALQREEPQSDAGRGPGGWRPPMTAEELGELLRLMREKWNM